MACAGSKVQGTGEDCTYKKKFESVVEINHQWKQEYERLRIQYFQILNRENNEYEIRDLRVRINRLEEKEAFLESELIGKYDWFPLTLFAICNFVIYELCTI